MRERDTLRGALVAYAGPNRLEYLLPFPLLLQRTSLVAPDVVRDAPDAAATRRDDDAR